MDIGEVLSKAWKIIWKHKVLWIFGILAGCGSGRSGSGSGSNFNNRFNQGNFTQPGPQRFFNQFQQAIDSVPAWVWILVAVLVLFLILLALFLGTIGRIGLVRGTSKADDGAEKITFGEVWVESLPFFWRVFLLNLVVFLLGLLVFAVLVIPTLGVGLLTNGIGVLAMLPFLCIGGLLAIVVFWVVGVVLEQATVAIVSLDLSMVKGLERGWEVVRHNIGPVLLVTLIVAIGGGIVGLIIALPFVATLIPIVFVVAAQNEVATRTGLAAAAVLFCLYLPFAIFFGGVLQSYIGALWTLTFRRLTAPKPVAPPAPELPQGTPAV